MFLVAVADTTKTRCWQPPRLTLADDGRWVEADMEAIVQRLEEVVGIRHISWGQDQ